MIQWSDKYLTGIEDIDKQHHALFKFFAVIEVKIKNGEEGIIRDAVRFMETYMIEHFKFEEMCMYGSNCPEAEANKLAHKNFVTKLKEFDQKVKSSVVPLEVLAEMNRFVETWLINHIFKVDVELKKCWRGNVRDVAMAGDENS